MTNGVGAAGGELAHGLVVGAVDLVEHQKREAARADLELHADERGVQLRWPLRDAVAARTLGLEGEARGAQFLHVLPDRDAVTPSIFASVAPETQLGSRSSSSRRMTCSGVRHAAGG